MLEASSAGAWGNRLSAAVDYDTDRALPRTSPPSTDERHFNLSARYQPRAGRDEFIVEKFGSVSTDPADPRFLPLVLERESVYVRVPGAMPDVRPVSNVTTTGSTRTIVWIEADAGSGSDRSALESEDVIGEQGPKTGIYALNRADLFNLLCIPPLARDITNLPSSYTPVPADVYQAALTLCVERRAMLIVDPDPLWGSTIDRAIDGRNDLNLSGPAPRRTPTRSRSRPSSSRTKAGSVTSTWWSHPSRASPNRPTDPVRDAHASCP